MSVHPSSLPTAARLQRIIDAQSSADVDCNFPSVPAIPGDITKAIGTSAPTSLRKLGVSGAAIPVAGKTYALPAPLDATRAIRRALTELISPRVQTLAEQAEFVVAALDRFGFDVVKRHQRRKGDAS